MKKLLAIIGLLFAFGSIATATEYYSTIDEQLRHEYFENNVKIKFRNVGEDQLLQEVKINQLV